MREPVASATPAADTDSGSNSSTEEQAAVDEATPATTISPRVSRTAQDASSSTPSSTQPPSANSTPAQTPAPSPIVTAPTENDIDEHSPRVTEATPQPATATTEAAKPTRGRKRAAPATPAEDTGEQSTAAPPKKRPRKKAAPLPGEEGYKATAPRVTRSRKRKASTAEDGEAEEGGEASTEGSRTGISRAQREATPPDAELVEIDITQVKMADLAKDMHIGKKFSLHDELMERERAKRLRYIERRKRQQTGEDDDDAAGKEEESPAAVPPSNPDTSTQPTPAATEDTPAPEDPADAGPTRAPIGETYQIIGGEIVLDHRSLQVDRHARAREEAGELVEVEENDFTNHTTSATYLRRNLKPQQWTDDETTLFYQALQAFGTDFDTISRMFKGKTRKHIKLKFNREERVNPQRITAALVGQKTVSIDMDQYQRATGQEYETAEAIYAEQKRAEEEFEARQKALEDEKAEEVRRKKEEVLAQLNSAVDGEGGGKKGGKKGRKRKAVAMGL